MTCLCGRQDGKQITRRRCSTCSPAAQRAMAEWRRNERRGRVRRSWEFEDVWSPLLNERAGQA